jgi:hypothetical protein
MGRFITSSGRDISRQTARDLRHLWLAAKGPFAGLRFWNEVLTEDDRNLLGNEFELAFRKFRGAVGIYTELNPRVSRERAILEIAHELCLVLTQRYRRLVAVIGERPEEPPEIGTRPHWADGRLVYRGELIREVPPRATRLIAILDAFERRAWPTRIDVGDLGGFDSAKVRQAVYDLNQGLKAIEFESRMGVVWCAKRPSQSGEGDNESTTSPTNDHLDAAEAKTFPCTESLAGEGCHACATATPRR